MRRRRPAVAHTLPARPRDARTALLQAAIRLFVVQPPPAALPRVIEVHVDVDSKLGVGLVPRHAPPARGAVVKQLFPISDDGRPGALQEACLPLLHSAHAPSPATGPPRAARWAVRGALVDCHCR